MNRSQEIIRTSWIGIAANVLTEELQPLVPDQQVVIVVDHNYSE